jgi:formylglycine-generating enzyme required for sulfatase activity
MKLRKMFVFAFVLLCAGFGLNAATPQVSNVQVAQIEGTKDVQIEYDLAYSGSEPSLTVWVRVSGDGGRSYTLPAKTFTGDVGTGVFPGNGRQIIWHMGEDMDGVLIEEARVRIVAHVGNVPTPPHRMEYIPGGHFQMGSAGSDGSMVDMRTVYVSPFFMDRYPVTGQLWGEVRVWALENGYETFSHGSWTSLSHPVRRINWFSAVAWSNARSEMEGLTPVYYTDEELTVVYRGSGSIYPNWNANGYRLPTEAEWEKAARGGLQAKKYPWGNNINGGMANFADSQHPWKNEYDQTTPVGYYNGDQIPEGPDTANGYGLYDMSGNIWEWCWDRWTTLPLGNYNPRGPNSGTTRVKRGGSWASTETGVTVYTRSHSSPSGNFSTSHRYDGVRYVRRP